MVNFLTLGYKNESLVQVKDFKYVVILFTGADDVPNSCVREEAEP